MNRRMVKPLLTLAAEAESEGGNTPSGETPAADEFKAITSQDDLNRVIADRISRERAKFADYEDVKTKAARLDEIEAANQTEAEKAAARVADLEKQLGEMQAATTRLRIANEHGITDAEDIALFLTGTDEETLTKQAKRLADRTADRKQHSNRAPNEGATPKNGGNDEQRAFARELFGRAIAD